LRNITKIDLCVFLTRIIHEYGSLVADKNRGQEVAAITVCEGSYLGFRLDLLERKYYGSCHVY
jgi:hypothetical protein